MPVTINGGMTMPAWYDIKAMDIDRVVDTDQLMASSDAVAKLVDREIERGVKSENIVIAGFSQGGAVAYELGLSYPKRLAGIIALSTYFATAKTVKCSEANHDIPIRIYHGTFKPHVLQLFHALPAQGLRYHGVKGAMIDPDRDIMIRL
eukprot:TRINITY_DN5343_c0_g2_i3.p1 TRINITY_DN5343_c0_g2~~TRINITY_DN5343_c0_g2_i3.p1  ORF type:complete len:149 (+),score=2.47 TRINITY_DN5343_c0_g2_i3:252-698(+)